MPRIRTAADLGLTQKLLQKSREVFQDLLLFLGLCRGKVPQITALHDIGRKAEGQTGRRILLRIKVGVFCLVCHGLYLAFVVRWIGFFGFFLCIDLRNFPIDVCQHCVQIKFIGAGRLCVRFGCIGIRGEWVK